MSDTLRQAIAHTVTDARVRWERYVYDCNPVDELDEHGRTLGQAIADAVLADPTIRRTLNIADAVDTAQQERTDWLYADELLEHLRAAGQTT